MDKIITDNSKVNINLLNENKLLKKQIKELKLDKKALEKQLSIYGVNITLPPEENILNAIKLLAEIDYENEWVWGHDTDLGKPKDVIEAFKNELLGN